MSKSFSYDDTDLASSQYNVFVERVPDMYTADPRVDYQEVPDGPGRVQSTNYLSRVISIPCVIEAPDITQLMTRMDAINAILDPNNGAKKIELDHIPNRYWSGVLSQRIEGEFIDFATRRVIFEFICPDSLGYSTVEKSISKTWTGSNVSVPGNTGTVTGATNATPIVVSVTSHGLVDYDVATIASVGGNTAANGTWGVQELTSGTFSLDNSTGNASYTSGGTLTQVVGGSTYAIPVIYVRNESGASASALTLTNSTTSEAIAWTGTLGDDYWLRIDCVNRTLAKSDSNGATATSETYTDQTSGYVSGRFPRLKARVANTFSLSLTTSGTSNATILFVYRDRYL